MYLRSFFYYSEYKTSYAGFSAHISYSIHPSAYNQHTANLISFRRQDKKTRSLLKSGSQRLDWYNTQYNTTYNVVE